jgi:hypothetical protein
MFGFFTRRRKPARTGTPASRRSRLVLEQLETRDCPATLPVISGFIVAPMPGHFVSVSGYVSDANPANVYVQLSGAISGTTFTNPLGGFHLIARGDVPGEIEAKAIDGQQLWSNPAAANLNVAAPSLTLSVLPGIGHSVVLTGSVTDIDAGLLTVNFTGAVTDSVTVGANGNYMLTTANATLGQVQAQTTNMWGVSSNPVTANITNNPPVISSFKVVQQSTQTYALEGTVTDESPAGLQVKFSGTPSTNGTGAWVADDGTFSTTVIVAAGESGMVTANCTDWWGAAATPVQSLLV